MHLWLFDVGVTEKSAGMGSVATDDNLGEFFGTFNPRQKPFIGVGKWLNRVLGMNLKRQPVMIDLFLKYLEREVSAAKRNGEYDNAIRLVTGRSVIIDEPRSFCLRGLDAPNERLLLYRVKVDKGIDTETAKSLYNEAMEAERGLNANGWVTKGEERKSGFYIDRERAITSIYLLLNQGRNLGVYGPSTGKEIFTKNWGSFLTRCNDIEEALDTWRKEFELDLRKRHDEVFVFSGDVVPVLDKIITNAGAGSMPQIVRVEVPKSGHEQAEVETLPGTQSDRDDVAVNTQASDVVPVVGQMVASKLLGNSLLRGVITNDNGNGTYASRFSDGSVSEMSYEQAKATAKLFDGEVEKLIAAKVPKADALSVSLQTAFSLASRGPSHRPILSKDKESKETEDYSRLYEEEYDGSSVPDAVVGLSFPKRDRNNQLQPNLHKFVLRDTCKGLVEFGAETPNELLSLEKAELKTNDAPNNCSITEGSL